jgi:hypothetical protein
MPRRGTRLLLVLLALISGVVLIIPLRRIHTLVSLKNEIAPSGKLWVDFHPHPFLTEKRLNSLLDPAGNRHLSGTSRPIYQTLLGSSARTLSLDDLSPATHRAAELIATFPRVTGAVFGETYSGTNATDSEWKAILTTMAGVRALSWLNLRGRELTDDALTPLASHPNLHSLLLNTNRLTPACLSTVAALPNLDELSFEHVTVATEADWIQYCAGIRKLPRLHRLLISGYQLTDTALAQLAGHPTLRVVTIVNHDLTAACATTLVTLPSLQSVTFGARKPATRPTMSDAERKAITTALPKTVRLEINAHSSIRFK